jgi:hypothetical protein
MIIETGVRIPRVFCPMTERLIATRWKHSNVARMHFGDGDVDWLTGAINFCTRPLNYARRCERLD